MEIIHVRKPTLPEVSLSHYTCVGLRGKIEGFRSVQVHGLPKRYRQALVKQNQAYYVQIIHVGGVMSWLGPQPCQV